ncbi:hypothetical protein ZOSMA_208G00100 [Zostera marina]|uniref:Uncharacterized protein n=1 Tax=Zostera marina TaxID=29655 RepID=A0A0K9PL93_ZOSMR|nr:hypothetical protein ZOSMA_208G00100 [Zostera marina]
MNDMVLEFLYYSSIRRSVIVLITKYGVPASFIDVTIRKPLKILAFFSRPRATTIKEKTEQKVESINQKSNENVPVDENAGEEDVVISDQQGEHRARDDFNQDMEWTASLTKSHLLGGNPYLTLPKKLCPEKIFKTEDPIYLMSVPEKLSAHSTLTIIQGIVYR